MKPLARYWLSLLGLLLSTAAWAQTPPPVTNDLFVASLSGHVRRLNGVSGTTVYNVAPGEFALHLVKGPDGALYVSVFTSVIRMGLETGMPATVFASGGGLSRAVGVAFGPDGNLYVGSGDTSSVIRYDGATGGFIDTFVAPGSGGLSFPEALLFGPDGNLYVTESSGSRVLRYDGVTGAFLGIFASDSRLSGARTMIFEPDGDLYVAGNFSNNVVRFDGRTGAFKSVFAAGIAGANGLAFGTDGNLYVAAQGANKIMRFDGTSGAFLSDFVTVGAPIGLMFDVDQTAITTVAGSGTSGFCGDGGSATGACLDSPIGVAVDASGNLVVADFSNNRIRAVDAISGTIATVAGSARDGFCGDGDPADAACLTRPAGVVVDGDGNLLIADSGNNRVRRVEAGTGLITTVAGSATGGFCGDEGLATAACLLQPVGIALDAGGNLLIADSGNHRIRRVDAITRIITTVAGNGTAAFCGDGLLAVSACLSNPDGVAADADGNLFIADFGNSRIRRVDATTGVITTTAGSATAGFCGDGGLATNACLNHPTGVALDADGNLVIADRANQRVRNVNLASQRIVTVAGKGEFGFCGDGGRPIRACLAGPSAVAIDPLSGSIVIGDQVNHRVRRF